MNASRISWRKVAAMAKAVALALGQNKSPEDVDAIIDALAETEAQGVRMKEDHDMAEALASVKNGAGRRNHPDFGEMEGW